MDLKLLKTERLLDQIPADLVVFSKDHKYIYINKSAIHDNEIREWLIGKDDFDYCLFKNKPISLAQNRRHYFEECIKTKKNVQFTEIFESPQGDLYCVRAFSPIINESGEVEKVVGYGYNDTLRINSQKELSDIKIAMDNAKDGIAILDGNGVYTYMNKAHATIFEYESPAELIGKTWKVIYTDEEVKLIENSYFPQLIKAGYWNGVTQGLSKYGKPVIQDITLTTIQDGGLICITRDLTETRKLLQHTKRLAIIAEKTKGLVAITDKFGKLQWANESFYAKTGYTLNQLDENPLYTFLYSPLKNKTNLFEIRTALEQRGQYQGKVCMTRRDGSPFWMLINISTVKDADNNITNYVLVQLDFNELHEVEQKLYDTIVKEKNLNEIKSKFINVTSHEIRPPLTNIELFVELIKAKNAVMPEGLEMLESISKQVKNITGILDDFLLLSKINLGTVDFQPKEADLFDFIRSFVMGDFIPGMNHRIKLRKQGESKMVVFDPKLMSIILKNLVDNAIKYSPHQSPVEILVKFTKNHVSITITDYGIGIPIHEQDKLFQTFYRCSNAEFIKGSGIGLSIVKEFLELMMGSITVFSEPNKITKFTITLPA